MNRSIPLAKMMDDAMIVFYQNGERIMPWNGYPMRLLLPGNLPKAAFETAEA